MASAGVLQPRVFLGRLFIRAATSFSQVWLASLRSVPLGMNWRTSSVKRLIRGINRSAEARWCSRCCRAARYEYPSCARAFFDPEPVSLDQRIGGFKEVSHVLSDNHLGR